MIDLNDIEEDSFFAIQPRTCVGCAVCGRNWPMKAGRSIVRRSRNELADVLENAEFF